MSYAIEYQQAMGLDKDILDDSDYYEAVSAIASIRTKFLSETNRWYDNWYDWFELTPHAKLGGKTPYEFFIYKLDLLIRHTLVYCHYIDDINDNTTIAEEWENWDLQYDYNIWLSVLLECLKEFFSKKGIKSDSKWFDFTLI